MAFTFKDRGFVRGQPFGWQTCKDIFDNIKAIIGSFGVEHSFLTGKHNIRRVPFFTGTYAYDSKMARFLLVGGEGTIVSAYGDAIGTSCRLYFTTELADYDIQITCDRSNDNKNVTASPRRVLPPTAGMYVDIFFEQSSVPLTPFDGQRFSVTFYKDP